VEPHKHAFTKSRRAEKHNNRKENINPLNLNGGIIKENTSGIMKGERILCEIQQRGGDL